jgi:hypothetical protein
MTFDYREMLPKEMDASSRVWIYQSSRLFSISEALQIEEMLNEFVSSWHSHGVAVKGYANLFYGQFIIRQVITCFSDRGESSVITHIPTGFRGGKPIYFQGYHLF